MELDTEKVIAAVVGRTILSAECGDGGMHLKLDDGYCVIFTGAFIVGVVEINKQVVQ